MDLLQGAVVYAGDRILLEATLTGKDPATNQPAIVAIPASAKVTWSEGQMTPGSNLVFETETSRFDTLVGVGGPPATVVLVDKVSQAGPGQVRVNFEVRDPYEPPKYWVAGQVKFATSPGERPMSNPNPTPVAVVPQNVTFKATLLPRPVKP